MDHPENAGFNPSGSNLYNQLLNAVLFERGYVIPVTPEQVSHFDTNFGFAVECPPPLTPSLLFSWEQADPREARGEVIPFPVAEREGLLAAARSGGRVSTETVEKLVRLVQETKKDGS